MPRVAIVGAGLCGNLLAIMLARRGYAVTMYEQGPDPVTAAAPAGRSINLALAARGIRALQQAGVYDDIRPLLLPMSGRIVHEDDGSQRLLPYGQHNGEQIWSVSRSELNQQLQQIALERWPVEYRFEHTCTGFDCQSGRAQFTTPVGTCESEAETLIAADGAGSAIRRDLADTGQLNASEDLLDHGYKEILVPATSTGDFALDPGGLHIWPRGGFMLIALPNLDKSFTATLFLPHHGTTSFDTVSPETVRELFAGQFSDMLPLLPDLKQEFATRPIGQLGTVHSQPWHHESTAQPQRHLLLIGDAAHAIVPFHGQGMNAGFEDCATLDRLLVASGDDWDSVLPQFESARRANTEAIARMALENYVEMRDAVRDPDFERRAELSFELERQFPGRFIPRYSMVMFHPEISYADAEARGQIQAELLNEAMTRPDMQQALLRAADLVRQRL